MFPAPDLRSISHHVLTLFSATGPVRARRPGLPSTRPAAGARARAARPRRSAMRGCRRRRRSIPEPAPRRPARASWPVPAARARLPAARSGCCAATQALSSGSIVLRQRLIAHSAGSASQKRRRPGQQKQGRPEAGRRAASTSRRRAAGRSVARLRRASSLAAMPVRVAPTPMTPNQITGSSRPKREGKRKPCRRWGVHRRS